MAAKPLSWILRALASAETMVPNPHDRTELGLAADVLCNPERLVTSTHSEPQVVIVTGPNHDPVADAILDMQQTVENLGVELHTVHDRLDELLTEIRRRSS